MAYSFQNGLSSSLGGLFLSRWLVELCTQVAGMTLFDSKVGDSQWTATISTGVNGASVVGQTDQLDTTGDGYSFTSADIGRYLTITGMTVPSRNGIYRITDVLTSKIVKFNAKVCVHEDGIPPGETGLTWRLWENSASYYPPADSWAILQGAYSVGGNWHLKVRASNSCPYFALGPYATWDAGTHAWSATDARNTSDYQPSNDESFGFASYGTLFACVDQNKIIVWVANTGRYKTRGFFLYVGEFTAFHPSVDPGPMVVIGCLAEAGIYQIFGSSGTDFLGTKSGGRWLAPDNRTTLTCYGEVPSIITGINWPIEYSIMQRWSAFNRKLQLQRVMMMYPSVPHTERRGLLKDIWSITGLNERLTPFGPSREYIHFGMGVCTPWNGSKVHIMPAY